METNRISLTPTVARQTQQQPFGAVLKNALSAASQMSGTLLGAVPGGGIVSAAISSVTSLASRGTSSAVGRASSGVVALGGGATTGGVASSGGGGSVSSQMADSSGDVPSSLTGMLETMRRESDRSVMMQMNMQSESREYNALSNVLKVRHDSAKAAINNLR